jgi:hypothetical protein
MSTEWLLYCVCGLLLLYYRVMGKRALRLTGNVEKIERQSKITAALVLKTFQKRFCIYSFGGWKLTE